MENLNFMEINYHVKIDDSLTRVFRSEKEMNEWLELRKLVTKKGD